RCRGRAGRRNGPPRVAGARLPGRGPARPAFRPHRRAELHRSQSPRRSPPREVRSRDPGEARRHFLRRPSRAHRRFLPQPHFPRRGSGGMTARAPAPARSALILHGAVAPGAAADDEDTLVQVGVVTAALRKLGFAVETLEVGRDLADVARTVEAIAPDFAFNLVEQIDGRDALLPLAAYLLERARIPYTGAPAAALAASTEKTLAKRLMAAAGIPTPEWCETGMEAGQLSPDDGLWIVKSATEHASFGLSAASVV